MSSTLAIMFRVDQMIWAWDSCAKKYRQTSKMRPKKRLKLVFFAVKRQVTRSNEHFKCGQGVHDEGATHVFAPSLKRWLHNSIKLITNTGVRLLNVFFKLYTT